MQGRTSHRAQHVGIEVKSMLILDLYVKDQISTHFHEFQRNFDDRNIKGVLTPFPSLGKKLTLFPRTFFDINLVVEKSTLFPHTIFEIILLVEKSMLFSRNFIYVILMDKKPTLFDSLDLAHTILVH